VNSQPEVLITQDKIKQVVAEVGWENLDAAALKSQLVKTKDLKLPWTINIELQRR